jgi:GNAT superfamily N-acetyltransferase
MEIKETPKIEEQKNQAMLMGIVPCLNALFIDSAWSMIREEVEKLADASLGEYTMYQVYQAVFFGQAHLYIYFADPSGKVADENSQAFILDKISRRDRSGLIGFIVARMDPSGMHLWQVFVYPEYSGKNVLDVGLEFMVKQAKNIGCKYLSFSTSRKGWQRVAPELKFEETFTTYRRKIE